MLGPGDEETWGPYFGHPHDPRQPEYFDEDEGGGSMTKYCYSFDDEENFTGTFDSHKNALAEAAAENTEDRGMVFIGEVTSAKDILTRCAKWLGLTTFENMSECLYEEVGEAVEFFTMNDEQLQELAMLIVNHTEEKVGFNCFGVSNIVEIALPVVESEEMVNEEEVPE